MIKHSSDLENLEDRRALRREKKKRPRMRQHSRTLKKLTDRSIRRIVKITKRKKI